MDMNGQTNENHEDWVKTSIIQQQSDILKNTVYLVCCKGEKKQKMPM